MTWWSRWLKRRENFAVDCSESERTEAILPLPTEWQSFAPYCTNKRTAETQRIDEVVAFVGRARG